MSRPHEELKDVLQLAISHLMHFSMRGFWMYTKEQGFSMTQMFTLRQIHAHEQQWCCNISMISEHLGVTNAAVSQSLDQLVQQGFALRIEDPQDRRNKRLSLTPKGLKALQGGFEAQQAWIDAFIQQLTDAEAIHMIAALRLLAEKLTHLEDDKFSVSS